MDSNHNEKVETKHNSAPSSFFREREATFKDQLVGILLGKLYKFSKNKRVIFFSCFPIIFIVGGVIIAGTIEDPNSAVSLLTVLLVTGNSFLMTNFMIPPLKERIEKVYFTLKAMGLKTLPYWVGNLIADFIVKAVMCLLIVAAIYIFDVTLLKNVIGGFVGLYLAFSFNMLTYSYNLTLRFNNINYLMLAAPGTLLGSMVIPQLFTTICQALLGWQNGTIWYVLAFIFFGPAILLIQGVEVLVINLLDPTTLKGIIFEEPWEYILALVVMGVLQFLMLLYQDSKIFEIREGKVISQENNEAVHIDEDDVVLEKQRLASPNNQDLIKAIQVEKVYPNGFKALNDLSFGVEKGQIFCLLGPNGAGKTTSFEILTAAIPKTEGTVQLDGHPLSRDIPAIFEETGICSQTNTLWESVTVEQHLRVYARIKGMKKAETDEAIQYLLKTLQLEEYADRGSDKLSGGNKRKLCVALSMIGAPKLLFLDEPSTGMDPIARSHLWTLIKDVMKEKQGAMVLTTHYMQEAELVGDKLGILINGRFMTIGSVSELKKRFGEYSVIVYESENGLSKKELDELVKEVLPEAKVQVNPREKGIVYKVPSQSMKFTGIFSQLDQAKTQGKIKDFSVYTTTLEQIFIKLAKHQRRLTES